MITSNKITMYLDEFIDYKHSLGFKIQGEESVLRNFARYTLHLEYDGPFTRILAMDWIVRGTSCDKTMARRLEILRPFAKYLKSFDKKTESIADLSYGNAHIRPVPYIYKEDEVAKLMNHCKNLYSPNGIRSKTIATVIALLWATGLRPTESTNLLIGDIDISTGIIHIRKTKFNKERYIPVDISVIEHLSEYHQWIIEKLGPKKQEDSFFYTTGGKPLSEQSLSYAFNLIRGCINAVPIGYPCVSLYDFRHSMACRTIKKWSYLGIDVNSHLHILSTFMGHVKPANTYWYISATSETLSLSCIKYEKKFGGNEDE